MSVENMIAMSHTTTEEKCGMDFSPSSGKATSGEKNFYFTIVNMYRNKNTPPKIVLTFRAVPSNGN